MEVTKGRMRVGKGVGKKKKTDSKQIRSLFLSRGAATPLAATLPVLSEEPYRNEADPVFKRVIMKK